MWNSWFLKRSEKFDSLIKFYSKINAKNLVQTQLLFTKN